MKKTWRKIMTEFSRAIKLQREIDELKKHKMLIGIDEKLKELDSLGYEYMEHNMTSSIRKKRK
jgi:hypothetical protein